MQQKITIRTIKEEEFDLIQPLWEGLCDHHAENSENFRNRYLKMTFDERKKNLINKTDGGKLRIDIAEDKSVNQVIAYCISSIISESYTLIGELDSIFIREDYRLKGIGSLLMELALKWFDSEKVELKKIVVAQGNENAFRFYKKYGFYPLHSVLQQKSG